MQSERADWVLWRENAAPTDWPAAFARFAPATRYRHRFPLGAALPILLCALPLGSTPVVSCRGIGLWTIEPPFAFITSKSAQVSDTEIVVGTDAEGIVTRVTPATAVEQDGTKISQRSELRETADSSGVSRDGTYFCYSFQFRIGTAPILPEPGRKRAKLTVAQFHQEPNVGMQSAPPGIFFDVSPEGTLDMVFSDYLGGQSHTVIGEQENLFGYWWRMDIFAKWSIDEDGYLDIWAAPVTERPTQRISIQNANTTTGHVYQKLGIYRHFMERDPEFSEQSLTVEYRDIARNGIAASIAPR